MITTQNSGIYGVRHMVKEYSNSERGNPLPPHGYYFRLSARVLLYASSLRQDKTHLSLCYTSRGTLALNGRVEGWSGLHFAVRQVGILGVVLSCLWGAAYTDENLQRMWRQRVSSLAI